MENQILASPGNTVPVNGGAWVSASEAVLAAMQKTETANGALLTSMSASLSDRLVTEAVLAGGLGLAAVVASVFLLVWFGRKVTGDLGRLDDSVRGMAEERLPRVVERLRRGDDVDVAAESPPPLPSSIQEISQVAESFGTVQAAAVAAAVDQARLRKAVNQVFLNISMRNQSLLHRQLGMLDSMERRTSEPEALADLFRLDHLTTRMRRHAEGLIILSGSTPGRGWRDPVPVVDVLRAAVAEVEDYVRVGRDQRIRRPGRGERGQRRHPPGRRARGERHGLLPAQYPDRGQGRAGGHGSRRGDRGPRPGPVRRRNSRASTSASPARRSSTSAAASSSGCSSSASWRPGTTSRSRSAGPVYGGTTAVVLLPFGVVVRKEEASAPGDQGGWPADNGARGLTGRHRLPTAASGRRADAGANPHTGEQDGSRLPRSPRWHPGRSSRAVAGG